MADLNDLQVKRTELNAAIDAYKAAVASGIQQDIDTTLAAAQAKGDEYAKLAGQVKSDNPGEPEDNFYSAPGRMSSSIREDVKTIMRTGLLFKPHFELVFDTEGNTAGERGIHLPFYGSTNVTIDWGDGNTDTANQAISHTYATAGVYTVKIEGVVGGMNAVAVDRNRQLKDVTSWGSNVTILNASNMFRGRRDFTISAKDKPNFGANCYCNSMFMQCEDFNSPIGHWDMSNVVRMIGMFQTARAFNQPLNNWNVAQVTNFDQMFYTADVFNQPLNQWDVSGSDSMSFMFKYANAFDQDISGWDVAHNPTHSGFADFAPIEGTAKLPNFPT